MSIMDLILKQPTMAERYMSTVGSMGGAPAAPSAPGGRVDTSSGNWEQIAQDMATSQYGYSPEDWNKLDYIIEHESNWNPNAINPNAVNGRQAMGIPQRMMDPGMADSRWMNNPMAQLRWLFNYIDQRYGGINSAYQFKQQNGWY